MESVILDQKYEYRLSFLQILLNPPGIFFIRLTSLVLGGFLSYKALAWPDFWWMKCAMYVSLVFYWLLCWMCLYAGSGPWRSCLRTVQFTKTGVSYSIDCREEVLSFKYMIIGSGMGVWTMNIPWGREYVMVPKSIISKSDLQRLMREFKKEFPS